MKPLLLSSLLYETYFQNKLFFSIHESQSGLNFPDLMLRQGVIDNPPKTKAPFIVGFECAGEIEAVGDGVTGKS
jgi:D-arabinose 1-dehydrogenase-like Zn-dependent alcohol dehydrogenase